MKRAYQSGSRESSLKLLIQDSHSKIPPTLSEFDVKWNKCGQLSKPSHPSPLHGAMNHRRLDFTCDSHKRRQQVSNQRGHKRFQPWDSAQPLHSFTSPKFYFQPGANAPLSGTLLLVQGPWEHFCLRAPSAFSWYTFTSKQAGFRNLKFHSKLT